MIGLHHIRHRGHFYCAGLAGLVLWLAAWTLHWPLPPLISTHPAEILRKQ